MRSARDDAIAAIEAAFADVAPPPDERLLHPDCRDDSDIRAFRGCKDWRRVDPATIEQENAALCFFSPEAFAFFLPAYLTWTLRNLGSDASTVDSTIYALAPGDDDLTAFRRSKLGALTEAQRGAVRAFLEYIVTADDDRVDVPAAREALAHWTTGARGA